MKLFAAVVVLALALAGLGVACGPEQTYCYDQHETCAQAQQDRLNREAAQAAAAGQDAQVPDDGGATVIGN